MANPDMKKISFPNAILQWPKLDQTYRWNQSIQNSEPCEQNANNAQWSCGFVMSTEEAKVIFKDLQKHYNECRSRDSKLSPFKKVFGMKKLDNGLVQFTAKKNGVTRNGKSNTAPELLMANLQPVQDRRIYSGSVGNGIAMAYPTKSPDGEGGISLLLSRIQLITAVYAPPEEDFEALDVETEIVSNTAEGKKDEPDDDLEVDPFGLPDTDQATESSTDIDDEIPF